MKVYFETADGTTIPVGEPMSPEVSVIAYLTGATGIRRIDDDTIDEFVRRADLYDTYIGGTTLREIGTGEEIAITRKILTETMGENTALWTDAGLLTPEEFDRMIRVARASR